MPSAQEIAKKKNIAFDQFIGRMREDGVTEPTARKVWEGDLNVQKSTLDAAAKVLGVPPGELLK